MRTGEKRNQLNNLTMNEISISGNVRTLGADVEKTRKIPFVFSDGTKDRHGTVLNQKNWKLDNYRKNPIVLYSHAGNGGLLKDPNPDYVIGRAEVAVEGGVRLAGSIIFEGPENPLAEKIFRKVLFGSLSRTSVGFREVGVGRYGIGDEAKYGTNETYYLEGQELIEISIVNIPSNPNSGKRTRTLADKEMMSALTYAVIKLANSGWRPSEIEKLTIEDAEALVQAAELEFFSKDIGKVKRFLADGREVRIQTERLEVRRARQAIQMIEDPIERQIAEYRLRRGINIKRT